MLSRTLLWLLIITGGSTAAMADNYVTTTIGATFKIANPSSTATCFVVTCPGASQTDRHDMVLVTAGHVFEKMTGNDCRLILRKRQGDGTFVRHEEPIAIRTGDKPTWVKHADVDVAALRLILPAESPIEPLPYECLNTAQTVAGGRFHTGDEIRVLSYPAQVEANGAGFPIVRRGVIAGYPLAPVASHRTFLADFNTFGGDSGAPVVLRLPVNGDTSQDQPLILGLVIGQHLQEERYKLAYEERILRHRLGIAIVVHAEYIKQTMALLPKQDEH